MPPPIPAKILYPTARDPSTGNSPYIFVSGREFQITSIRIDNEDLDTYGVRVEYCFNSNGKWKVVTKNTCMSRKGEWRVESTDLGRTEEFVNAFRFFSIEEAVEIYWRNNDRK